MNSKPPGSGRGRGYILDLLRKNAQFQSQIGEVPEDAEEAETASVQSIKIGVENMSLSQMSDSGAPSMGRGRGAILRSLKSSFHPSASSTLSGGDSGIAKTEKSTASIGRGRILFKDRESQYTERAQTESTRSILLKSLQSSRSSTKSDSEKIIKTEFEKREIPKEVFQDSVNDIEKPPEVHKGNFGEPISIMTNYIRLLVEPGRGVFEYEVRFKPDIDNKGLRINALNQHLQELGGVKTFDGCVLYLPMQLTENVTYFTSTLPTDNSIVKIKVMYKKKQRLGECIHLYNVLFKRIMSALKLVRFGRQNFDPTGPMVLPQHKLEIWPGYVTAVDEYEGGIMLCIDSSHRVLCQTTVLEFLHDLVRNTRANIREEAAKNLIGQTVLTRYNNKSYRIDEIMFDMNPMDSFSDDSGNKVRYLDYFKQRHNVHIHDLKQPLLVSRTKRRVAGSDEKIESEVHLIPECSYLTGLSDSNRTNFNLMKDIATYTRVTPNQRVNGYNKFLKNVSNNKDATEILRSWGLRLAPRVEQLSGRLLKPEDIQFGLGKSVTGTIKADWGRDSCSNPVFNPAAWKSWAIFFTQRDANYTDQFKQCVMRCAAPMGININEPKMIKLPNDRTESYINRIREEININKGLQLVVCICPTSRDDRYAAIKKLCCSEKCIASQVINSRTISKMDKLRSVTQKIALQINCKLGGSLWSVFIPLKNVMICGIDTYHDPLRKGGSVTGFVASMNQSCTQYYSDVGFQNPHEEIGHALQKSFRKALMKFNDTNGIFPEKIIIFRDGVGDGQLNQCKEAEIQMMEKCFENTAIKNRPLLTFIVVQKRINTRLMTLIGNKIENAQPGTVMDHTITRRNWYDFFLVPQNVRQGTVTPTHYIVLKDTANMKPDHCQTLAYKMCHLYYNWAGTVRVPAVCQYAHKLAYLIGQNVRQKPQEGMNNRLYYL